MRILVAVDDSRHSERAVRFVTRMRWPAGSRMLVASVMRPPTIPPPPSNRAGAFGAVDLVAPLRALHDALIARALGLLRAAGFSAEARLAEGDAREQLMQLVQREHADLLVMGSRGRSGLARLMLGSVSNHAVNQAPCSVLVVKPVTWTRGPAGPRLGKEDGHEDPDRC